MKKEVDFVVLNPSGDLETLYAGHSVVDAMGKANRVSKM